MHLAHIQEHSPDMVRRSKMQGFDMQYEAKNRLATTDTIADRQLAYAAIQEGGKVPAQAFKTTDVIMHERMAVRPFEPYQQFDVAAFADYGKPKYDKREDMRLADGTIDRTAPRSQEKEIGNPQALAALHPNRERNMQMQQLRQERQMGRMQRRQNQYQSSPLWGATTSQIHNYSWGNSGS